MSHEAQSRVARQEIDLYEPIAQRTYTPSKAVLARSSGCYHYTPEGRRLADFTSGVLVANLGHHPRHWWQSVWAHMQLIASDLIDVDPASDEKEDISSSFLNATTLTAYNAITEIEALAARRLVQNMQQQPGGRRMEQVLWAASGSEAVHKALTVALAQRKDASMILATRYGFHGKKGLAGAVTGCEADPERDPRVRFISFPQEECYSVQLRKKLLDLKPYRQELERLWRAHEGQICCLITEPYLGGGGSYHPQAAYLQMLQQFCREHGILFILDEVQSNFGRTGMMYAYSTYGIEPDMVVLGKGMGNGIPVDAVVGPRSLFEALSYGSGSDTWSGHPLGCAAVLATLEIFEQGHVLEHATKLSEVIEEGLLRLTELDGVEAIRGEGTVWGIQCEAAGDLTAAEVANRIVAVCYEGDSQGRAIHLLGPLAGTVLRVAPPLVMDLDEARDHLHAMHGLIQRCHWQH